MPASAASRATPDSAPQPAASTPVVFATWNVHGAVSRRAPFDAAAVADALAAMGADVIALQETSALEGDAGHDHVASIAALLGMHAVFGANLIGHGGRYRYGNAILSRWPVVDSTNHDLSVMSAEPRGALVAELETPGGLRFRAASLHFGLKLRERAAQARQFVNAVVRGGGETPLIIGGDMNDWIRSADTRAMRAHLRDAATQATYPAAFPVFRLDHVYVDESVRIERCTRIRSRAVLDSSDHLPLVAHLHVSAGHALARRREAR